MKSEGGKSETSVKSKKRRNSGEKLEVKSKGGKSVTSGQSPRRGKGRRRNRSQE